MNPVMSIFLTSLALPFLLSVVMIVLSYMQGMSRRRWLMYGCMALLLCSAYTGLEAYMEFRYHRWGIMRGFSDASLLAGTLGSLACAFVPPWRGLSGNEILFRATGLIACLSGGVAILIATRLLALLD